MIHKAGMTSQSPGWAERLKGQTIVEDAMEGRAERAALVEQQHQRMMQQMENIIAFSYTLPLITSRASETP